MDYLKRLALLIQARRGLRVILIGFWLVNKPDKNEEETRAARSFLQVFYSTIILTLLNVVFIVSLIIYGFTSGDGDLSAARRTGTVENGRIRYVLGTNQYIEPEDINLQAEDLKEGEKVRLYFDNNDNMIGGEINRDAENRIMLVLIGLFAIIIFFVIFAIVTRATFGKPWHRWYQSVI